MYVYTPGSCIDIAGDWAAVHARQLDDIVTERVRGWTQSLNDVSGDRGKTRHVRNTRGVLVF